MTVYEKPENVYGFFMRNQYVLESKMMTLCEDKNVSIQIFSECGDMIFTVFDGDCDIDTRVVFADVPSAELEAQETYEELILEYFDGSYEIDDDMSDEIEASEKYIDGVIIDMIDCIVDGCTVSEIEEAVAGIKELVCDVLTKRYGFDIRRPMYLVDKDGNRSYEEYPYRKLNAGAETVFK